MGKKIQRILKALGRKATEINKALNMKNLDIKSVNEKVKYIKQLSIKLEKDFKKFKEKYELKHKTFYVVVEYKRREGKNKYEVILSCPELCYSNKIPILCSDPKEAKYISIIKGIYFLISKKVKNGIIFSYHKEIVREIEETKRKEKNGLLEEINQLLRERNFEVILAKGLKPKKKAENYC
jgi:hypothetical protein